MHFRRRGAVIVAAPAAGVGSWAGAPGLWREGPDLFVTYRLRGPRPLRGYEMHVAIVERDGKVRTLARIDRDALDAESIERSALVHEGDEWRLYVSYVARAERTWRIDMLRARSVDAFDARGRAAALRPEPIGMSAVKDPWLRKQDGHWLMFVSCGRAVPGEAVHASGDALSTGLVRSETGLATSADGIDWKWEGIVFSPSEAGWDRATARLTTAWRTGRDWTAYYDGAASIAENYEERCGLACSRDLRTWERIGNGPVGDKAPGAGARYVDVTAAGDVAYEYTRADGAHDLYGIVAA